jgi:4-amino-4-deoxy-L-arabinose transferase-like glycosyltransferase
MGCRRYARVPPQWLTDRESGGAVSHAQFNTPAERDGAAYRPWPRPLLAVLCAAFLLSLWVALRFPLLDPDEGRNAEVAREMAASGDLVIPHLAGVPYLDKPPALFAAAAAAVRIFGPRPFAPRLPAMIASLAALLLLAQMARSCADDSQALRATLLAASAPLFAGLSAYVIFDMPLAFCVTVLWTGLARELTTGVSNSRRAWMYAALALGVLLKGPIMLGWALGGSLATAIVMRRRSALGWLTWWPGWLLVIGLGGGWFALALRRHPEFAHYAFVEESLERLTTSSFHREQPWWFVPVVLVAGTLPWSVVTPWRWPVSVPGKVAAGFVLFACVFFSLSHSKLVTYLLPVVPALAYIAAEAWGRRAASLPRPLLIALLFTPLVLVGGSPWLYGYVRSHSGAALAAAIRSSGGGNVRYEDCYSPGTDFLLDRGSAVVSETGAPLTSNYILRYRDLLRQRGQWRLYPTAAAAPPAAVIVRATKNPTAPPPDGQVIFQDARYTAWRLASAGN